jgi:hypothetical protein
MPHKRSEEGRRRTKRKEIQWTLKSKILVDSFRDTERAETASRTNQFDLIEYGVTCFPEEEKATIIGCAPAVELGLILIDSKGDGEFQK